MSNRLDDFLSVDTFVRIELANTGIVKVIHAADWQSDGHGGGRYEVDVDVTLEDDLCFRVVREIDDDDSKSPWRVDAKDVSDAMYVGNDLRSTFLACVNKVAKEPIIRAKVSELIASAACKVTLTPTIDQPAKPTSPNDRFISALGSIHPRDRARAIVRVRDHLELQNFHLPAGDSEWPIKGWRIAEDGEAADVVCVVQKPTQNHPFAELVEVEILDQYHVAARLRVATSEKPGMGFVQLTVAEARGKTTEEAATDAMIKLRVILRALSGC